MSLRAKLFLLSLGLIALCVLIAYGYARRETEAEARRRIIQDLVVRLQMASARVEAEQAPVSDLAAWDAVADRLGQAAEARVSIISAEGSVVGDSMVDVAQLPDIESHRTRPEVQDALAGRVGIADRYSRTARRGMLYAAGPLLRSGQVALVVRVALPTAVVEEALGALQSVLLAAAGLALSVAVSLALFTVQLFSSRVSHLTRTAQQMAGGNLEVRARVSGGGELAQLGRALDRLARSLSTSLADLRLERDRMSGILSSMEEGVLFLDDQGRVVLVNPALRSMLMLSGDPTGRSLLEVVRHAELKEMVDAAIEDDDDDDGDGPIQGEIRFSGIRPRQLLVSVTKLEGVAQGVVGIFMDVTETRRLENLRREFVANVSHELRTPVTSIRSAAETLSAGELPPRELLVKFIGIIDRNAARLHSLVEDLLDLSRIESRQFSLTLGPLEPRVVMEHMAALAEDRAARRRVQISVEAAGDLAYIRADRRALEHVLSNLVDNAVKYGASGGRVILGARQEGEQVVLSVRDFGPGIEKKHLSRLFERFYRVDAGRSRDLGGTGLGLAIVKHLVESMSGSVSVESEVGAGTIFRVSLPAIYPSRRPPAVSEDDPEPASDP